MLKVNAQKCVGCGICMENCPVDAITLHNGKAWIDEHQCIGCENCLRVCPRGAVERREKDERQEIRMRLLYLRQRVNSLASRLDALEQIGKDEDNDNL